MAQLGGLFQNPAFYHSGAQSSDPHVVMSYRRGRSQGEGHPLEPSVLRSSLGQAISSCVNLRLQFPRVSENGGHHPPHSSAVCPPCLPGIQQDLWVSQAQYLDHQSGARETQFHKDILPPFLSNRRLQVLSAWDLVLPEETLGKAWAAVLWPQEQCCRLGRCTYGIQRDEPLSRN